ncbi:hypothetical protein P152DRAFT_510630 [Eremomyces bilateralis CBS 781.70]|uniref:Uncharacterized protein n=1 Tax=Eremomyces bilateralis CBS 781.70 TaxID=1392243 RepID=A0A6G1GHP5_9PEZI|nr:uncharacterized protein P152DRAFT_510630 [Eremomyces bilateralis CBS 781.70]KAF1817390.1 hypothetical protein P152DRAFT_510630 [Eremomyces bilateralis CBS 781.70]
MAWYISTPSLSPFWVLGDMQERRNNISIRSSPMCRLYVVYHTVCGHAYQAQQWMCGDPVTKVEECHYSCLRHRDPVVFGLEHHNMCDWCDWATHCGPGRPPSWNEVQRAKQECRAPRIRTFDDRPTKRPGKCFQCAHDKKPANKAAWLRHFKCIGRIYRDPELASKSRMRVDRKMPVPVGLEEQVWVDEKGVLKDDCGKQSPTTPKNPCNVESCQVHRKICNQHPNGTCRNDERPEGNVNRTLYRWGGNIGATISEEMI